jgi:Zn-dependent peptidase ImmA (M78 family)
MTLKVFGWKIKVVAKPLLEDQNLCGYYDSKKKQITIDSGLDKDQAIHTLIHEIFHSLSHRLGYNQFLNQATEEAICEQFATVLCENFDIKLKK